MHRGAWRRMRRTAGGAVLIALAFVALDQTGKSEPAVAVVGVQTFEWRGRP